MVGLPDINSMLLRRPFSIARVEGEHFELLYKVMGRGTGIFSRMIPGERLAVLGPLGRGFQVDAEGGQEHLIVAGGIGNAAFPLLIEHMLGRGVQPRMFFGARSREDLTLLDWFEERCGDVTVATEDGSAGHPGLITDPFIGHLDSDPRRPRTVYACGPKGMLHAVWRVVRDRGIEAQLSLEEHMACGFGVCLGCVVPVVGAENEYGRYRRSCVDGPVFRAAELDW
jgi:dihydroorotate dehydrogenase electron transfer subunit